MSKIIGVICIIAGSVYLITGQVRAKKQELLLIQSFMQALHAMESAIRWKGQAVPACLQELKTRKICGSFFQEILHFVESNITLQESWYRTFASLPQDIRHIMYQVEWDGDEARLLGNLQYAAEELNELYRQRQTQWRCEEKLLIAAIGSVAGMLIIILL